VEVIAIFLSGIVDGNEDNLKKPDIRAQEEWEFFHNNGLLK